ncbi:MAG: DUF3795 domain-containing protein [Candidatus Thorarchaeota archaeon]
MKEDKIAYCGLDCSKCGALLAKANNDYELRKVTAVEWSTPEFAVLPEEVNCDGCRTAGGTHFKYCAKCDVRQCASQRGVKTCAHCSDYACEKLKKNLDILGEYARSTLESIRASLN